MFKETLKRNKGITLIALVVTIIVLLILAGISISMLTGQNGILNRAAEAKEKTGIANEVEQRKLAQSEALTNMEETTYKGVTLPKGFAPTRIEGEDSIDEGLVITDGYGNEYVWIEVPKSIYKNSEYNTKGEQNSADDLEKIRDCLKAYTDGYSESGYSDTNPVFELQYQNMLKSVYTNGGFWIGRYEAGLEGETSRKSHVDIMPSDKAVVKQNMIPYNYVTRNESQELAKGMKYEGCTSSLIFGVQWDLMLKFIETKKKATDKEITTKLTSDSTKIGNYMDSLWNVTNKNAKYSKDTGKSFNPCPYEKKSKGLVLLTTGADENFSLMNIYDIAGNVTEWTLEYDESKGYCVQRGGCFFFGGTTSAKHRMKGSSSGGGYGNGFRIGLWIE